MPARKEIPPQLSVVVNLAVEDDPYRFIFICHGLMAGIQVDDAQTAHADGAALFYAIACIVGTPVPDLIAHYAHGGQTRLPLAQVISSNAAHNFDTLPYCNIGRTGLWPVHHIEEACPFPSRSC